MHPRVGLHQVAMITESTTAFVEHCRAIGVPHMTMATPLLLQPGGTAEAQAALARGGPRPTVQSHPFCTSNLADDDGGATQSLLEVIELSETLGSEIIYLVTGGRGSLLWEDAAERFAELIAPCRPVAAEKGIKLTVEIASHLNCDIHMAHTLDDCVTLADIAGIGVCLELQGCWFEGRLKEKFRRAVPKTALVQISDYVPGDKCVPGRAVIGDGIVPVEKLLGDILELGYEGIFDLELLGPRIQQEGPREATKRAAENLSEILMKLGA